jgi:hypothetical protein
MKAINNRPESGDWIIKSFPSISKTIFLILKRTEETVESKNIMLFKMNGHIQHPFKNMIVITRLIDKENY